MNKNYNNIPYQCLIGLATFRHVNGWFCQQCRQPVFTYNKHAT